MIFDDSAWLGDEYARLGPAARAGLGVLIAKGDWSWWYQSGLAAEMLREAIPHHGVASWAGDPELLTADQWLEPARAVEIGVAFKDIVAYAWTPLRLKVARSTWNLGDPQTIDAMRRDLIDALDEGRVFVDWPADRRPRRVEVERDVSHGLVITGSANEERFGRALAEHLPDARWVEDAYAADVVIAPTQDLIARFRSADLAIALDSSSADVMNKLDAIRSNSAARCAMRLDPAAQDSRMWLSEFGRAFGFGKSIDEAIAFANDQVVPAAELIAATQTFVLHSHRFTEPRPQPKRSGAPRRVFDLPLPSEVKRAEPLLPQSKLTSAPVARVLNASVEQNGREIRSLPAEGAIKISLGIHPRTPVQRIRPAFPEAFVEWRGENKLLQVHMLEVDQVPITRMIKLPREGPSENEAVFPYEVRGDRNIDLRFVVADGARIVQTARLQGAANALIRFYVETINASVEHEKESFDLALMVNNSLGERPSAMALTREGIALTMLDGHDIANAREDFRTTIKFVAENPDLGIASSLFELASKGKVLLDSIRHHIPEFPARLQRVQVVTQADAYFPLEYLYDGDIPEDEAVGLCPDRHDCLESGVARPACPIRAAAERLCPMGFLGISSVIERQTWKPEIRPSVWLSRSSELTQRNRIACLDKAVFAAADLADHFMDDEVSGIAPVRIKAIEDELGPCHRLWSTWKQEVEASDPSLLILVPHVEAHRLHIGESDKLLLGAFSRAHVGKGHPLVIAIGCNTAVAPVPSTSLPAILTRNGACVVIAALTEVLGRYANYATLALLRKLREAANGEQLVPIGALLTQVRRQLLAKDLAIGMVLVAYGDADYVLGKTTFKETVDL
jgi:hypothetical protein